MKKRKDDIAQQLTLCSVLWNVRSGLKQCGRLSEEWESYGIKIYVLEEFKKEGQEALTPEELSGHLLGICTMCRLMPENTILVTNNADLAEAVYHKKNLAVVFYEPQLTDRVVSADMIVQGFDEVGVQFLDRVLKRHRHLPWNILYTKRTVVREITLGDLDELYELYEGEGITDYTEPLYERSKEEEYTRCYIDNMYYYYGYGMWIVRHRSTGQLIGRAGIEHRVDEQTGQAWLELGYIIGTNWQRQGFATEVCHAIMDYARDMLELKELNCFIHPDNVVSRHLARSLGFSEQGIVNSGGEHYCRYLKSW